MKIDLAKIATENRNQKTLDLDLMSSLEIVQTMNQEDNNVVQAIKGCLPNIAKLVDLAYSTIKNNGRVIYLGAGTSGRLGVCDASEIFPTFGLKDTFLGLMAGGEQAFINPIEGAEDNLELAVEDLKKINLTKNDLVIGIAASGRTPYVIGGLKYAQSINAHTGSIACSKQAQISTLATVAIEVEVGPEVLTGSTRLKAGTAQKLILNMISTATMVKCGKCYSNLMVDVVPTNQKLHIRAQNIVQQATGCNQETAIAFLKKTNYQAKLAIVMILDNCSVQQAEQKIILADGHIRQAIKK